MSCDHNIIIIKEPIQTWLFMIKYSNIHQRLKRSFYLTVDMLKLPSLITTEIFFHWSAASSWETEKEVFRKRCMDAVKNWTVLTNIGTQHLVQSSPLCQKMFFEEQALRFPGVATTTTFYFFLAQLVRDFNILQHYWTNRVCVNQIDKNIVLLLHAIKLSCRLSYHEPHLDSKVMHPLRDYEVQKQVNFPLLILSSTHTDSWP